MKKNVLILVDLEGIIGVRDISELEYCRKLMIDELLQVIGVLNQYGYHQVTVCNIHNDGKLLGKEDAKLLGVELITGVLALSRQALNFEFAMLLGFHSMKGVGGNFDHTFRFDFDEVWFDGNSLGEVGLYTRWFELSNIPVLLVSGEGNFIQELIHESCLIHIVDGKAEKDLSLQYEELKRLVDKCLQKPIRKPSKIQDGNVEIIVDNNDKYELLSKDPYHYCVINQKFVFSSLNDFFYSLYDYSVSLNRVTGEILRKNRQLGMEIIQKRISIEDLDPQVVPFFSLPLSRIDCSARIILSKILNNEFEDKHNKKQQLLESN